MNSLPATVRMIIMSHLSDIQEEIGTSKPAQGFYMKEKLNFVKHLLLRYPDTTIEVYPNIEWERFQINQKDIELREYRDAVYDLFENDVDTWSDILCSQYLEALSDVPVIPETVLDQKKLILDLEYNYIMQASKADIDTLYEKILGGHVIHTN